MSLLISGSVSDRENVLSLLVARGEMTSGPDYNELVFDACGIDDIRSLTEKTNTLPNTASHRVFVTFFTQMTIEAQNALLKTLEEPRAGALLVLVTPNPEQLLPTVLSRVQHLSVVKTYSDVGMLFLKTDTKTRLNMIQKILDTDEREMRSVVEFLESIEHALSLIHKKNNTKEGLGALYRARKYCGDKGSLLKPLLEQVALLAPRL